MKQTINFYDFSNAFHKAGRGNQFTYDGLKALFDYLEEYEESTGEEMELDVVALCCDYAEYDSIADFWVDYGQEEYPDMEAIADSTEVIMIDEEAFIIASF
tara:strand:+ start:228 stop:530 length:303 start_codon:yes stop_codon:yes gene_type:complete